MTAVAMPEHLPMRPTWVCSGCGEEWPCAHARLGLTIEFAEFPATLQIYLSSQYCAALADLWPWPATPDLYARFMLWTDLG